MSTFLKRKKGEGIFYRSLQIQVTISYIDEEQPFQDRAAALRDYGFACTCPRCCDRE